MHTILLCCEVFIALFGVFSVIIADNTHERLHGLFVVGLALEGFLSHYLPPDHIITFVVLIVLSIIALLMIAFSLHSLVEHLKKYFHHIRQPENAPPKMALTIDAPQQVDNTDLHSLINEKHNEMHQKMDKMLELLQQREQDLALREQAVAEKEKQLGIK